MKFLKKTFGEIGMKVLLAFLEKLNRKYFSIYANGQKIDHSEGEYFSEMIKGVGYWSKKSKNQSIFHLYIYTRV